MGRFVSFHDVTEIKKATIEREKLVSELQEALGTVKTLSGLLPVCAYCHRVRDEAGTWDNLAAYVRHHSEAEVSHGICPECAGLYFEEALPG